MESSQQDSKGLRSRSGIAKGNTGSSAARLRAALKDFGPLELLTVAALVAGVLLITAEFMNLFDVTTPAGDEIRGASKTGGENHGYALLVIALVAMAAVVLARFTDQWPPAGAAAALGLLALLIVLAGDLPDTNDAGLTAQRKVGTASPALGLWVELIGSLVLAGSSAAIALILRKQR